MCFALPPVCESMRDASACDRGHQAFASARKRETETLPRVQGGTRLSPRPLTTDSEEASRVHSFKTSRGWVPRLRWGLAGACGAWWGSGGRRSGQVGRGQAARTETRVHSLKIIGGGVGAFSLRLLGAYRERRVALEGVDDMLGERLERDARGLGDAAAVRGLEALEEVVPEGRGESNESRVRQKFGRDFFC